jgi:plastocyanin
MRNIVAKFCLLAGCLTLAGATQALAQDKDKSDETAPTVTQIVALDECDPATFNSPNAPLGADFCRNVALAGFGYATTFGDFLAKAAAGTPDPGWDFEPDAVKVKKGTTIVVVNQGGEPHTFTEVAKFGGGFITPLNHGEDTVDECKGGFSNVKVARTRILQGSQSQVTGLSKGTHLFECCIHPWMRTVVEVK